MFACWKSFSIRKGLGPLAPTCQYSNNGLSLQSCASAIRSAVLHHDKRPRVAAYSLILHFWAIRWRAIMGGSMIPLRGLPIMTSAEFCYRRPLRSTLLVGYKVILAMWSMGKGQPAFSCKISTNLGWV